MKGQKFQGQVSKGAIVEASDGVLGTVKKVFKEAGTGAPIFLEVQATNGPETFSVPASIIQPRSSQKKVYLAATRREVENLASRHNANEEKAVESTFEGKEIRIPLAEERLNIEKRNVQIGEFMVYKTVDNIQEHLKIPVIHDEAKVERVKVNMPIEKPAQPRYEGTTLIIPVMEEVLVVEKRLMLVEEIRITTTPVTLEQEVQETRRVEKIQIEDTSNHLK